MEDIELLSVIATRMQAKENDMEHALRTHKSGLLPPRKASGSSLESSINLSVRGTPSINGDRSTLLSTRTFPEGSWPNYHTSRACSGTMSTMNSLQVLSPSAIERARFDTEFGICLVDAHTQADFVATNTSSSQLSLPLTPGQQYQRHHHQQQQTSVSVAKAIFYEVLEE